VLHAEPAPALNTNPRRLQIKTFARARIYAAERPAMKRKQPDGRADGRVDDREYVRELSTFVREPTVRHCLNSIQNDCLTKDIVFSEDGQACKPAFHRHLQFRFKAFARECIEYLYTCQFIPWYIERLDGEAVPRTLPFGSFTWQAQFKQPWELSSGTWPIKYELRGIDFDLTKLNVRIFYAVSPLLRKMSSPLDTLHGYYKHADVARSDVASCVKPSLRSLVLVSETLDTKIQNEDGIDLLDASRRYQIGGGTSSEYAQRQVLMSADSGAILGSVNEAQMCWLSKIQEAHENLGISLLPPNSTVTQVSAPSVQSDVMTQLQLHYRANVHTHFNVRLENASASSGRGGSSTTASSSTLTEQKNSVLQVVRVLEDFLPQVYKATFKATGTVTCALAIVNKLEVNNVADVKVLCECGILGPLEVREMLAVTLTKSKPDPCKLVSFAAKPKK